MAPSGRDGTGSDRGAPDGGIDLGTFRPIQIERSSTLEEASLAQRWPLRRQATRGLLPVVRRLGAGDGQPRARITSQSQIHRIARVFSRFAGSAVRTMRWRTTHARIGSHSGLCDSTRRHRRQTRSHKPVPHCLPPRPPLVSTRRRPTRGVPCACGRVPRGASLLRPCRRTPPDWRDLPR